MVLKKFWSAVLAAFLTRSFRTGDLTVRLPGGVLLHAGDGSGPAVSVTITDSRWLAPLALNPSMAAGEAYMDGALLFDRGTIHDLVDLAGRNGADTQARRAGPLARLWLDWRLQRNDRRHARRNVAHHYDLSEDFYRRFLDADLQYSCAYFAREGASLEEAQAAKKRHIARKLLLEAGQKVLDIGCGWGGLALSLAETADVEVHGVTLSGEQLTTAQRRAQSARLADRVRFSLTDYRDVKGRYDRIVSVGMFEHVGRPNFQQFFDQVASLLADDGVALIHSIGQPEGPALTHPWIAKYIFPGGYIPALSEVLPCVERAGLIVNDIEVLRLHYAETLRAWRMRFEANRQEVSRLYDDRFCRMWDFYLACSEMSFRHRRNFVFQLQLTKRIDVVPLTREYQSREARTVDYGEGLRQAS